ncbi:MAG: Hsp33 family molecular chaperone HslO [Burkholderiales bacterium]
MTDFLQRFLFEHAPIRGEIVHLDATWRTVLENHDYPPALRALLGEMMAAAALLAATLKFDGTLILQIQGGGPVRLLVVECTSQHHMRATAKWDGEPACGELRSLVGAAKLVITLVSDGGKQSYQSVVELEGAGIAEVLEHYMQTSEQLATRLWLACDDRRAAGLLLQKLPQREEADSDDWRRAQHLASTLSSPELLQLDPQQILHRLYHEDDLRIFGPRPVVFRCSCTRERVVAMLRMLGHDEIRSILDERGNIDVNCEFCNRKYRFDRIDAELVFATAQPLQAGTTRH